MTRTIPAVEARQRFGQLMNEVQLRHDHVIVARDGKPMAALVPIEEYRAWMERREELFDQISVARHGNATTSASEIEAEVAEAVTAVRRRRRTGRAR